MKTTPAPWEWLYKREHLDCHYESPGLVGLGSIDKEEDVIKILHGVTFSPSFVTCSYANLCISDANAALILDAPHLLAKIIALRELAKDIYTVDSESIKAANLYILQIQRKLLSILDEEEKATSNEH